jgi:hypothetical protein
LQVPDGHLLPHAQEALVSLGSELPFGRVAEHLERMLGVVVHASTTRRQTLAVGQRMLQIQNEQAQPLAACPEEKASERMAMSSDGAIVPLVGGVWAEVKGVAIGAVERRRHKDEEEIVTTKLTYFARMASAATFADQASAEVRRRGIERAKQVCAIQDGAEWIQDGCRKAIGTMHCAFSTLHMQLATSVRSQTRCATVEGICLPSGWLASCTGSSTRCQRGCCAM